MTKAKRAKLKGKKLLDRLTGISTPIGGVSWTPPINEAEVAKKLLVFLEDRRVLFTRFEMEIGVYVLRSVEEIRVRLTKDLEQIDRASIIGESISAMRASCRKFMTQTQDDLFVGRHWHMEGMIWQALGELRAIFGLHIARIACAYNLEIEEQLIPIIPEEDKEENSERGLTADCKKTRAR